MYYFKRTLWGLTMIVKFIPKKGGGSCQATMRYLLGANNDREQATVLRGDPKLTQYLADSLDFKHGYTVGVLSFKERDLQDDLKNAIMDDFERTLFCGMDKEQYNICWIQHQDKDRLELNFVIPKVELRTGKNFNPYYDRIDRQRVNDFKTFTNAHYNLHDPDNPSNKQAISESMTLPKGKKAIADMIHQGVLASIESGAVASRQDVIDLLTSSGFDIARITDKSISIADPQGGRNLRLKGAIYEKEFAGISPRITAELTARATSYERELTERADTARKRLETAITERAEYNAKRYRGATARSHQDQRSVDYSADERLLRTNEQLSAGATHSPSASLDSQRERENTLLGAVQPTHHFGDRVRGRGVSDVVSHDVGNATNASLGGVYEPVFQDIQTAFGGLRQQEPPTNASLSGAKGQHDKAVTDHHRRLAEQAQRADNIIANSTSERTQRTDAGNQRTQQLQQASERHQQEATSTFGRLDEVGERFKNALADVERRTADLDRQAKSRHSQSNTVKHITSGDHRQAYKLIETVTGDCNELKQRIDRSRAEFLAMQLVYANTNQPLSMDDKQKIVDDMPVLQLAMTAKRLRRDKELNYAPSL